jgi:hypothetical protein
VAAVRAVDHLGFSMPIAVSQHGVRTIRLTNSPDLVGDDGGSFVPGDPPVLTLAPVLCITSAWAVERGAPVGSQSTLMRGYLIRLGEYTRLLYAT